MITDAEMDEYCRQYAQKRKELIDEYRKNRKEPFIGRGRIITPELTALKEEFDKKAKEYLREREQMKRQK